MSAGWLRALAEGRPGLRAALLAAHPDDETLGAAVCLMRLQEVRLVHVTDGAPRDGADARRAGCSSPGEYAELRRQELKRALGLIGACPGLRLGIPDQEAVLRLKELTDLVSAWLERERPGVVLSHPYEGGHPDHDATAFALQCACRRVDRAALRIEMTS